MVSEDDVGLHLKEIDCECLDSSDLAENKTSVTEFL
jgi:hypothetical protein